MANVGKSAAESVSLNLDTLDNERNFEEFAIVLKGRRIVFRDPMDFDWKETMELEQPIMFFRYCFSSEDDKKFFLESDVKTWKVNTLIDKYLAHFDLASSGGGVASRLSSGSTARR